mgnify:CR=1 FL=1
MHKAVKLLSSIGLCLAIGALGSIFTSSSVNNWYESILKPSFNPPNWLFGPVWTILFILMGITLYLLLIAKKSKNRTLTLKLFYAQLGFNLLWSIFFHPNLIIHFFFYIPYYLHIVNNFSDNTLLVPLLDLYYL